MFYGKQSDRSSPQVDEAEDPGPPGECEVVGLLITGIMVQRKLVPNQRPGVTVTVLDLGTHFLQLGPHIPKVLQPPHNTATSWETRCSKPRPVGQHFSFKHNSVRGKKIKKQKKQKNAELRLG